MASLPSAIDAAEPVVAAEIIVLDPTEIEVGERLREVDPIHAEAVGHSMIKDGQINPIDVCRLPGHAGWHLAGPGGHRLAGALIVGLNGIEARVVSPNRDMRRLREAVENFFRRANDPIERAAAVAEIVEIKRRKAGLEMVARRDAQVGKHLTRQINAEAEQNLETISRLYGWTDEIGAELGFTGRTIRNDLLIFRGIAPSLVSQLRSARHPVLKNATQLRAIAKLDEIAQRSAIDALVAGAKTVAEATRAGGNRPVDPEAKRLSAFIGAFSRMGTSEKKAALFQLAGLLPPGVRLETGADEAKPALDAAFDFFQEVDRWDPASSIELLADRAKPARMAVQSALMTINGSRPRSGK